MTSARRFPRGIRDKLVLAFSTLVAAIALFVFFFFPARLERQTLRATASKAEAIRQMTAYSVAAGLLFGDRTAVSEVLVGAAVEDVAFIFVWNDRDELVAAHGAAAAPATPPPASPTGAISDDDRHFVTTTAVISNGRRVGTLTVGLSLATLRAEVASARRIGALVGSLILAVGLLLIFAISTFVTRPLKAVGLTVNRIADGDLTLRATETSDVEVARFVRAFNRMIDMLVGAQAALADANVGLEVRVDERTAALRAAVEEMRLSRAALALSEADVRRANATLEALIAIAPLAIITTDAASRVTRWNHEAERLFGWTADEVLGLPAPFLPHADERTAVTADAAAGGPSEVTRRRKDGSSVSVLLGVRPLTDEHDAIAGFIHVLTDLTEHKRLEAQLLHSQKMDALGRLAGGIAHDFNNLITVIMSCAELMAQEPRNPSDEVRLRDITGAGRRAAGLTRQLLTFTRQQVVQPRLVDISAVVRDLEPMLRRVLPSNIRFATQLDAGPGVVRADPSQIEQVVMNLVINAADAMADGGSLRIETRHVGAADAPLDAQPLTTGTATLLIVEDTGLGMDDATLEKAFEPFFTTKGLGRGTGLGLSTAYGIITGLGGAIRVRSAPGKGSTFTIVLPEATHPAQPRVTPAEAGAAVPSPRSAGSVLVVEDEPVVRDVMRRLLEFAGFNVTEADGGEAALEILSTTGDHLLAVVTDVMMPGMTGRALSDVIAQRWPGLGVVFVSGYTQTILEGISIDDEHRTFLQKPFTGPELAAAIARVSGARQA
jgi:PAS domain S-box-containing protein